MRVRICLPCRFADDIAYFRCCGWYYGVFTACKDTPLKTRNPLYSRLKTGANTDKESYSFVVIILVLSLTNRLDELFVFIVCQPVTEIRKKMINYTMRPVKNRRKKRILTWPCLPFWFSHWAPEAETVGATRTVVFVLVPLQSDELLRIVTGEVRCRQRLRAAPASRWL